MAVGLAPLDPFSLGRCGHDELEVDGAEMAGACVDRIG